MIAVSFALPTESSDLVGFLRDRKSDEGEVIRGKIDNKEVAIFHTGVGGESCKRKIDNFFSAQQPRLLISSGFAGAAREDLQVGDLLLAENFSDPSLLFEAQRILTSSHVRVGKLFTSSTIVDSIDERNKIAREHNAVAVDMETECIAQACAARQIRMLSLRVISDTPREPFPVPPRALFDIENQRAEVARLLFHLLTHPTAIWRLIRFGSQIRKARARLTNAMVALIKEL
jgi:adenosylhomocysteine nucleosidase